MVRPEILEVLGVSDGATELDIAQALANRAGVKRPRTELGIKFLASVVSGLDELSRRDDIYDTAELANSVVGGAFHAALAVRADAFQRLTDDFGVESLDDSIGIVVSRDLAPAMARAGVLELGVTARKPDS